jgi:hypothetical protein
MSFVIARGDSPAVASTMMSAEKKPALRLLDAHIRGQESFRGQDNFRERDS